MAENVRLAEELFPDRRIVAWEHNTHARHASEAIPVNPDVWRAVEVMRWSARALLRAAADGRA